MKITPFILTLALAFVQVASAANTTNIVAYTPAPAPAPPAPASAAVVVPAPPATATCSLALNTYSNFVNGFFLYAGNAPGQYISKMQLPLPSLIAPTTNANTTNYNVANWTAGLTITNLNPKLPWFFALSAYLTNSVGQVTGYSNTVTHVVTYTTNYFMESDLSDECLFVPTNVSPFLVFTNGVPEVGGYGVSNRTYTIATGVMPKLDTVVATLKGSNSVWFYTAVATNGHFFKITVTTTN